MLTFSHYCTAHFLDLQARGRVERVTIMRSGVPTVGGGGQPLPPEIPKALQNRAELNPIVKTVKIAEFRTPTPQDVRKKGS